MDESGPEWRTAWNEKRWPANRVIGSALVALGVFAEACLGIAGARSSRKKELDSNKHIAELNAETERLRKENNETALLREYRSLGNRQSFIGAMRPFSETVFIVESVAGDTDASLFRMQLDGALREAGWIPRRWISEQNSAVKHFGLTVLTVVAPDHDEESVAARALAEELHKRQIAVFAGTTTHIVTPGVVILQIGPKPETIEQRGIIRSEFERRTARPVTPPQA